MVGLIAQWSNKGHPYLQLRKVVQLQVTERPPMSDFEPPRVHAVSQRLSQDTLHQIVADYLAGMTSRAVGERYGISKTAVIELVRQAGHQPRPRGPLPDRS